MSSKTIRVRKPAMGFYVMVENGQDILIGQEDATGNGDTVIWLNMAEAIELTTALAEAMKEVANNG
jgi:hypothetical protein